MRNLIIHPQAQSEIMDAYKWYRIRSEALGYDFLRETDKSIYSVTKSPLHYPIIEENIKDKITLARTAESIDANHNKSTFTITSKLA